MYRLPIPLLLLRVLCALLPCVSLACAAKHSAPAQALNKLPTEQPVASGIEGMRWVVRDDPTALERALKQLQLSESIRPCSDAELFTLGFRAFVIHEAQLGALLAALGGTPALERVWFGQVTKWTDVATHSIAADTLISLRGRASSGSAKLFQLEFRGWTFPTVQGSASTLELRALADAPTLSGLPTRRESQAAVRGTLLTAPWKIELARNDALVLLADPALAVIPDTGPDAAPLPTVADVLLKNPSFSARREVLVFLPRFADTLPKPLAEESDPPLISAPNP